MQTWLDWLRDFLGPTIFGSLLASITMIIWRRLPPKEAAATAAGSMLLAIVLAPPLAEWVNARSGITYQNSLILCAGMLALVGRDGIPAIIEGLVSRFKK